MHRAIIGLLFVAALFAFNGDCACSANAQPGKTLYVSPTGSDAAPGTMDRPFATLQRARDEIRRWKRSGPLPAGGVTVVLRGGIHALAQTFKLGPEDSGTAEAPIVYRGAEHEQAVVIGGKLVQDFTPYRGEILQADLAGQGLKGVFFHQLFFDGKRQHVARWPNFNPQNPYGGGWAYADGKPVPMYQDVPGESHRTFQYKAADERVWSRPEEAEIMVFPRYNWWNNIVRIAKVDRATRTITLAADCSYPIRPGDRYYVQNVLEELDAPGEWYLDRHSGTLYFWPPAPLAGKPVYVPTLRTIVELGAGTSHVTLRNLTVECCEGTAVVLRETHDCLVAACTIRNAGDYNGSGISVSGGQRNGVAGCDIYEIGSHGVALSGGDRKTLTPAENYADNNYIHHVGVFYKQGVGVSLNGVGNRASHNLIHDGPRMGIMFGGNNLIIEYNHIRHVNLETCDTGAVYTGGRDWISSRGSQIRYNYFHDVLGYGLENGKWTSPHFAWGVYLDDNTGGVDVVGNIVARCMRGLVHLHNGRDNHIENNVFVDGTLQQIEYSGWTDTHPFWTAHLPTMIEGYEMVARQPAWKTMRHMELHPTQAPLPDHTIMAGNVLQRNIFYYRVPSAQLFRFSHVNFEYNKSDDNLIYHFDRQPVVDGVKRRVRSISGPNLAPNGDFAAGKIGALPTGWTWQVGVPAAVKAFVTDQPTRTGNRVLQIDGWNGMDEESPAHSMIRCTEFPANPGRCYRLTAWMRADKPGTKAALVAQAWKYNAYSWGSDAPVIVGPAWKQYEHVFKFPGAHDQGYNPQMKGFYLRLDACDPGVAIFVDDVRLQEAQLSDEWEAWRALGQDQHSLVADPRFANPEKDDYRLSSDSPAFKLGFKPIPIDKIGPYADPLRATWPIVEAEGAREKPLVSEQ